MKEIQPFTITNNKVTLTFKPRKIAKGTNSGSLTVDCQVTKNNYKQIIEFLSEKCVIQALKNVMVLHSRKAFRTAWNDEKQQFDCNKYTSNFFSSSKYPAKTLKQLRDELRSAVKSNNLKEAKSLLEQIEKQELTAKPRMLKRLASLKNKP